MSDTGARDAVTAAAFAGDADRLNAMADDVAALTATDIFAAAALGDAAAVQRLLADDAGLAVAKDEEGIAPLLYATRSRCHRLGAERAAGLERTVRLLLEHGADPNTSYFHPHFPDSPLSALYNATGIAGNAAVARILLEAGARTQDGESIYHAAEHNYRDCLEVLLQHGADISARQEPWGNTPLYFLMGYAEGAPGSEAATEGIRWLLEHGADPNVTSYAAAETPLHLAVRGHRGLPAITMLLDHGADPNAARADGRTPYQLAVRYGRTAVAELLAKRGADTDASIVDRFLGAMLGNDEDAMRAMLNDDPGLLRMLSDDDKGMIVVAAQNNRLDAVKSMVRSGFDIAAKGEAGATALHHAAWRGHRGVVEYLLESGAPLDVKCSSYQGTPLDWAVHGSGNCHGTSDEEYINIVQALVHAGADPNNTYPQMGSRAVGEALQRMQKAE